ncbi:hypothetical protein SteCoe_10649 [Stentor coeruleus]|uniref:MORN repeat protein n=1 Tax=Stentor coeruleus TaxID=5963 RepID=A0A1R2CEV9_9CILI|nr:hypothetical protein SteCoe_10649 [Stentor coeruleus]
MGSCNCMHAKNEPANEITQDLIPTNNILNQPNNIQEYRLHHSSDHLDKEPSEAPQSLKTNVPGEDTSQEQLCQMIQVQALFRGIYARRAFENKQKVLNLDKKIPEEAILIVSSEAKQAYFALGPLKIDMPVVGNTSNLYVLKDGSVYCGEWNDIGCPEGKGTMFYNDGSIYEGIWKEGMMCGYGRRISPKADVYVGEWVNGKIHGNGKILYSSNNSYEGEWKEDMQDGKGIEVWGDGSRFEGSYKNGLKNGYGKFCWTDGSYYIGEFLNDHIHGKGKYVWINREYEGEWKENKMNGKGIFKWNDGKTYEGDYFNDQKHGWGVFSWPDGKRYEGYWFEGKQNGEGTLSFKDNVRSGIWKNGKLIKRKEDV